MASHPAKGIRMPATAGHSRAAVAPVGRTAYENGGGRTESGSASAYSVWTSHGVS